MTWPSEHAEKAFRALFPQYPNAGVHFALDILVDTVRGYRRRDEALQRELDAAFSRQPAQMGDDWTRGT
jgi:hypothetical protein